MSLPFGKGKQFLGSASRAVDLLIGGWQVGGIFTKVTGEPFTVTTSGGITNAGGADRPNRLRDGALPASERSIDRWFDVSVFQVQPNFTYGNSGRNILFGPGVTNLDFSLAKFFQLTEKFRLQILGGILQHQQHAGVRQPRGEHQHAGCGDDQFGGRASAYPVRHEAAFLINGWSRSSSGGLPPR